MRKSGSAPQDRFGTLDAYGMKRAGDEDFQWGPGHGFIGAQLFRGGSGCAVMPWAPASMRGGDVFREKEKLGVFANAPDQSGISRKVLQDGLVGVATVDKQL